MQAMGNTSLVRQIGEIPMMPPVSCSASQYQDPDTVHCSAKLLRDTSFTCLLRCPGQTCPQVPFRSNSFKREASANTVFWLGDLFKGSPKKQNHQCVCVNMCVLVTQSCSTLCNPMDCCPPGSSGHEILQARILEWIITPFSRGSSWPRDWTRVSYMAGRYFYHLSHR